MCSICLCVQTEESWFSRPSLCLCVWACVSSCCGEHQTGFLFSGSPRRVIFTAEARCADIYQPLRKIRQHRLRRVRPQPDRRVSRHQTGSFSEHCLLAFNRTENRKPATETHTHTHNEFPKCTWWRRVKVLSELLLQSLRLFEDVFRADLALNRMIFHSKPEISGHVVVSVWNAIDFPNLEHQITWRNIHNLESVIVIVDLHWWSTRWRHRHT